MIILSFVCHVGPGYAMKTSWGGHQCSPLMVLREMITLQPPGSDDKFYQLSLSLSHSNFYNKVSQYKAYQGNENESLRKIYKRFVL